MILWNKTQIDFKLKHCVKSVRIRSFSGPYFPAFELNTERHSVSLCIQSECWKKRTRITPNTDTFHAVKVNSGAILSPYYLARIFPELIRQFDNIFLQRKNIQFTWYINLKIRENYRSSHQKFSKEIGVLKNLTKFTGKHLWQNLFCNKVAGHTFFTEHLRMTASVNIDNYAKSLKNTQNSLCWCFLKFISLANVKKNPWNFSREFWKFSYTLTITVKV